MKRFLLVLSVALLAAAPATAAEYAWTISSSPADPLVNTGATTTAPFNLYLWLFCSSPGGMAAAEFDVALPPGMLNFGFSPLSGYLNAGGASNILLAVGGCPPGPTAAGSWTFFGSTPGSFCLVNSAANGIRVTVDCDPLNPQAWPITVRGYGYGMPPACAEILHCGDVVGTEPKTWGGVKSLYR